VGVAHSHWALLQYHENQSFKLYNSQVVNNKKKCHSQCRRSVNALVKVAYFQVAIFNIKIWFFSLLLIIIGFLVLLDKKKSVSVINTSNFSKIIIDIFL
jgi:hypothetical protein